MSGRRSPSGRRGAPARPPPRYGYVVLVGRPRTPGPGDGTSVTAPVILRFAGDLRLADNPALADAIASGRPVLPVVVDDPDEDGHLPPGGASAAWREASLVSLDSSLRRRGSRLVRLTGPAREILPEVARAYGADALFRDRRRWPAHVAADAATDAALARAGVRVRVTDGQILHDPGEVRTRAGGTFMVFTPFAREAGRHLRLDLPGDPPARIPAPDPVPLDHLTPVTAAAPPQTSGVSALAGAVPGERGADEALRRFIDTRLRRYAIDRDLPGVSGTSGLSPHLRFGEISPARVWVEVERAGGGEAFLRQLLWREFAYSLLESFPSSVDTPLHARFAAFPWSRDYDGLAAWQEGRTGYPLVDAGMRQLLATGLMHNRARMVVASFLVKDLLLPWQQGAVWFWNRLLDADMANNTLGWQWVAGSGADAAPFVRVFNPVLQGRRFDADGTYVRTWVPELAALPDALIHRPWEADARTLREARVDLGATYPRPVVDHAEARKRALAIFEILRREHR